MVARGDGWGKAPIEGQRKGVLEVDGTCSVSMMVIQIYKVLKFTEPYAIRKLKSTV